MDTWGFVESRQAPLIVLAFFGIVGFDVSYMVFGQSLNGILYVSAEKKQIKNIFSL